MVDATFDFKDFDSPIKTFRDDINYFTIRNGAFQYYQLKVRENFAELYNNYIFSSFTETLKFYNIGSKMQATENSVIFSNYLFYCEIALDQKYDVYERKIYTLFDMFGQLGGIYAILFSVGGVIVNSVSSKIFVNTILSRLYQVTTNSQSKPKVSSQLKVTPDISFDEGFSRFNKEEEKSPQNSWDLMSSHKVRIPTVQTLVRGVLIAQC